MCRGSLGLSLQRECVLWRRPPRQGFHLNPAKFFSQGGFFLSAGLSGFAPSSVSKQADMAVALLFSLIRGSPHLPLKWYFVNFCFLQAGHAFFSPSVLKTLPSEAFFLHLVMLVWRPTSTLLAFLTHPRSLVGSREFRSQHRATAGRVQWKEPIWNPGICFYPSSPPSLNKAASMKRVRSKMSFLL